MSVEFRRYLIITIVLLLLVFSVHSFQFSPIVSNFSPKGAGSVQNFKLSNDGDNIIAVQISMHSRKTDIDGLEINENASSLFKVYPSQLILKPGEAQVIRVQWIGDNFPIVELPFRIIAEQLPVNFKKESTGSSGFNFMFRYIGSVYVGNPGMKPDIQVASIYSGFNDNGAKTLILSLFNSGTAHTILNNLRVEIKSSDAADSIQLSGPSLEGIEGKNMLAGEIRKFIIPWPEDLSTGELDAVISFDTLR